MNKYRIINPNNNIVREHKSRTTDMKSNIIFILLIIINHPVLLSQSDNLYLDDINSKVFTTINDECQFCRLEFFNDSLFCYTLYNAYNDSSLSITDEETVHSRSYETIGKWTNNNDTIILNTIYPSDSSMLQILTGYLMFENRKFIYNNQSLIDLMTLDLLHIDYSGKLLGEKIMNLLFEAYP